MKKSIICGIIAMVLFAAPTFVSAEEYSPSAWATNDVMHAEQLGIGVTASGQKYDRKLTRNELAFVAVRLYELILNDGNALPLSDADRNEIANEFSDSYTNGRLFDDHIFLAIKKGLLYGTSEKLVDGRMVREFSPDEFVTREQTVAVLYRIMEQSADMQNAPKADLTKYTDYGSISPYALEYIAFMVEQGVISGKPGNKIAPKDVCTYEEVLSISMRFLRGAKVLPTDIALDKQEALAPVYLSVPETDNQPVVNAQQPEAFTSAEAFINDYSAIDYSDRNHKDIELKAYGSNEEAMEDMVEVTIKIWKMDSNGNKTAGSSKILVHNAVAEDVVAIFDEIFAGEEKYPIKAVLGYNFRGVGNKSAHNQGLAIDINPDENFFVSVDGSIRAGKFWDPEKSPYSIKPDGDVVRAFNAKGWYWGGIGWDTTGKDFMHFSYTGT